MPTVEDYLRELDRWRDRLANFLTARGVESAESEKFNDLVPKVLEIASGNGGSGTGVPVLLLHSAGNAFTGEEIPRETEGN